MRPWPIWHYAVVDETGPAQQLILYSGTTANRHMSIGSFSRKWSWAGQWGMLALRADQLPATADLDTYMTAATSMEAIGKQDTARIAHH